MNIEKILRAPIQFCELQVMDKLVDIVLFLNREITNAFGSTSMYNLNHRKFAIFPVHSEFTTLPSLFKAWNIKKISENNHNIYDV